MNQKNLLNGLAANLTEAPAELISTSKPAEQPALQVIYPNPKELTLNRFNSKTDGGPSKNQKYKELLESIKICGILQPIIITKEKVIRSGNLRHQIAVSLGLTKVPCIVEVDSEELYKVDDVKGRAQIIDNYKTISHDIKKVETPFSKLMRIKVLEEYNGIRQGVRSDKDPKLKKAKEDRDKIAKESERAQLKQIQANLEKTYPGNEQKQKEFWDKVGNGKSISAAVKETKRLAVKAGEKPDIGKERYDYITSQIKIYNQSCMNLSHIPDKSIRAIVGSPPDHLMKPAQKGFVDELGQEKNAKDYAKNLVEHYIPCKRILMDDGSIWVVINEGFKDGSYTGSVEWFIVMMLEEGFLLNDVLIWAKYNTQPSGGNRSTRNFEYILKFTLKSIPKSDFTWLNEFEPLKESVFGTGAGIKLASFIHLKEGFVRTSTATTALLREACEKEGFYLEHSSTYPPEIPFLCIKTSCEKGDHVVDLFNGCGNTAKAVLYADMNLTYHGFEINPLSVRASKVNIALDFDVPNNSKAQPFPTTTQSTKAA
jgi:DNA modification methylase